MNKPQKLAFPTKGSRPYAALDFVAEQGTDPWPVMKYNGREYDLNTNQNLYPHMGFSPEQKILIKFYNAWLNDGLLVSDARAEIDPDKEYGEWDVWPELNEMGALDSPEVDHIIPSMSGGSNVFGDARLTSWYCNNKQERNKVYNMLI